MMGAIVLSHRWLGVAFGLLFAMWFSTGIVMHFVPFPSLTEAERFAGLTPLDHAASAMAVADALAASGISDATRVAILSGLKEGEKVVTGPVRALKKLHDGDAIEVTTEKKSASTTTDKEK